MYDVALAATVVSNDPFRSISTPVAVLLWFVQARSMDVGDAAVAPRPVGAGM